MSNFDYRNSVEAMKLMIETDRLAHGVTVVDDLGVEEAQRDIERDLAAGLQLELQEMRDDGATDAQLETMHNAFIETKMEALPDVDQLELELSNVIYPGAMMLFLDAMSGLTWTEAKEHAAAQFVA